MGNKKLSIIGIIFIVLLAVGFVIEYKAVTVSIENNLKVAKGDVLAAIDEADKN